MSSSVSGASRADVDRQLADLTGIYASDDTTHYTMGLDKPISFPKNIIGVGIIIPQRSAAPLAAEIGGTPSDNNFMICVVANKLMSYQCDGTTVTAKQLAP